MKRTFAASLFVSCGLALAVAGFGSSAFAQTADAEQDSFDMLNNSVQSPAEDAAKSQKEQIKDLAFQSALDSAMPMSPGMIRELIGRMSDTQRAASPPLGDPSRPKAKVKAETISLAPGAEPPVVKVAAGYVTSIMILDATGAPWPIADLAYAGKFDVKMAEGGTHILRILPLLRFQEGNVSVQLKGLAAPVTVKLMADTDEVYYRYDLRVPAIGPRATPPRIEGASRLAAGDASIMAVLDGVPPNGAKRLKVTGVDDRSAAWDYNGQIYLRTPHSLLSPAWDASVTSGDGTTVYAIPDTPVLLLSDQGMMVRARLSRPEGFASGDMLDDH